MLSSPSRTIVASAVSPADAANSKAPFDLSRLSLLQIAAGRTAWRPPMGLRYRFKDDARMGSLAKLLVATAVIFWAGLGAPATQAADVAKGEAAFVRQG